MNQTVDSRKYSPTALALYITYFVLGVAATIMGQYKQNFAALWGTATLADGSYDVSGVVAVIAAIGLGRLIAFPVAGPLSDRLGRRLSALIGCGLYAIFLLGITFAPNLYVGYALAVVSGMANSFLDTSITPSCMEIFKEKGTIANIFTKLSISIAQFLLPFAIGFVAAHALPFRTIFIATAIIIIADGVFLAFLPFPPFEKVVKVKGQKSEKMHFTPAAIVLVCLGFTTSTTFMLWMNCNQELGTLYGLADPSKIQSFYSVGMCQLFGMNHINCGLMENYSVEHTAQKLRELCHRAEKYTIGVEPMPYSGLPDIKKAWAVVKASGCDNAKLILDSWHWVRAGQSYDPSLLADIPAEKVVAVQINDVQAHPYAKSILRDESMHDRMLPGTGYGDTAGFVKMLWDKGIQPAVMGVEVISDEILATGVAAAAKANFDATRAVLAQTWPEVLEK